MKYYSECSINTHLVSFTSNHKAYVLILVLITQNRKCFYKKLIIDLTLRIKRIPENIVNTDKFNIINSR